MHPPTAPEVAAWLAERIGRELGVPAEAVDAEVPFADFGLSSLAAMGIAVDLEDWLGRQLPATLVWEHPTIARLARHLGR